MPTHNTWALLAHIFDFTCVHDCIIWKIHICGWTFVIMYLCLHTYAHVASNWSSFCSSFHIQLFWSIIYIIYMGRMKVDGISINWKCAESLQLNWRSSIRRVNLGPPEFEFEFMTIYKVFDICRCVCITVSMYVIFLIVRLYIITLSSIYITTTCSHIATGQCFCL